MRHDYPAALPIVCLRCAKAVETALAKNVAPHGYPIYEGTCTTCKTSYLIKDKSEECNYGYEVVEITLNKKL